MRSIAHLQDAIIDDGCIATNRRYIPTRGRVENEENKRVNREEIDAHWDSFARV